ncbi:MAG: radical SAM protein [Bacteroidetes bacterium]|nr:MAG: radical SAM protein [Bacteroidota bacterium]
MIDVNQTPAATKPDLGPEQLFRQAFSVRRENFPDEISFFAPGLKHYSIPEFEPQNPRAFLPISLTGAGCALDCDHCNKKILEPMIPLNRKEGLFSMCQRLAANGTESVLISGGSLKTGEVPFIRHIDDIRRVKEELGLRIIMHTGLIRDEKEVAALKDAGVDGVALDIIGSNETIREVYHLDATVEDFDRSLELLAKYGLSLRPHIILGLHYGKFLGEYQALDMIAKYPVHSLVVVILVPMSDTNMWGIDPPDTGEVADFFVKARLRMPDTNIMLGCARPLGDYKKIVDKAAVEAGFNGIAYPAEGVVAHAKEMGLKTVFFENSCSCGT